MQNKEDIVRWIQDSAERFEHVWSGWIDGKYVIRFRRKTTKKFVVSDEKVRQLLGL